MAWWPYEWAFDRQDINLARQMYDTVKRVVAYNLRARKGCQLKLLF